MSPSNQHHSLASMQYTHQLPSPVTTNAPSNLIDPVSKYMRQQYLVHQPGMDVQTMITPPSYSPIQSPKTYYGLTGSHIIQEHDIKIENNHHNVIQAHVNHGGHLHTLHHHLQSHPQHSRSPSVEDEKMSSPESNLHELQNQILARNSERPSVVNVNSINIKME